MKQAEDLLKKEKEYTPKVMGVGRPRGGHLHQRTKKFRIVFEWERKIFRDGGAGIPVWVSAVLSDHSFLGEVGIPCPYWALSDCHSDPGVEFSPAHC